MLDVKTDREYTRVTAKGGFDVIVAEMAQHFGRRRR